MNIVKFMSIFYYIKAIFVYIMTLQMLKEGLT